MEIEVSTILQSLAAGVIGGGAVLRFAKEWLTERLKQSIAHEYAQKLEEHKVELNARVTRMQNEFEVSQLRTSLFFDHQRAAFAEILTAIAATNAAWWDVAIEKDTGEFTAPVPGKRLRDIKNLYVQHQLFLDADCVMAVELLIDLYQDTFYRDLGNGHKELPADNRQVFEDIQYVYTRLGSLFRSKIAVESNSTALRQIACFGGMRLINNYHFQEIELPARGVLKMQSVDRAAQAVAVAQKHPDLLVGKLTQFVELLERDGAFFHEEQSAARRYLAVLKSTSAS